MRNPMMSFWLSCANSYAGTMQAIWTAAMRRQQAAMMEAMTQEAIRFWSGAWMLPTDTKRTGARRRT